MTPPTVRYVLTTGERSMKDPGAGGSGEGEGVADGGAAIFVSLFFARSARCGMKRKSVRHHTARRVTL
jgi:hypothetical protein